MISLLVGLMHIKKIWHYNDIVSNKYNPAVEWDDGYTAWYIDGKLHRDNGPAIITSKGDKFWHQHNNLHRLNGPAVECAGQKPEYYINNVQYTYLEWLVKVETINNLVHCEITCNGTIAWYTKNHQLHNKFKQAISTPTVKKWYINNKLHRIGGPAIKYKHGGTKWFIDGKEMQCYEYLLEYYKRIPIKKSNRVCVITHRGDVKWAKYKPDWLIHFSDSSGAYHNRYKPAISSYDGHTEWYFDGQLHRLDGPAVEYVNGAKEWRYTGKRHSFHGPAVIDGSKNLSWWVMDTRYFSHLEYIVALEQRINDLFTNTKYPF